MILSNEAIKKIACSEEEAESIVSKASQRAKAIIAEAEEESVGKYEAAVNEALAKSKGLCENARTEAARQSGESFLLVDKECDQLYTDTRDRINSAIDLVVERVVKGL